ncbi:MAG: hypothetical protein IKJ27_07990 [Clostridia bacterium]|nr:hypothetical protein [Clostridia bacterium]
MKFISKNSRFAKILAVIFSLLMLITATDLPVLVGVVASAEGEFTVTVTDKATAAAIDGATVTITPDEATGLSEQTGTTASGVVTFADITEYFSNGGAAFSATYKVTADMYVTVEKTATVTAEGLKVELNRVAVTGIELVPCNKKYDGNTYSAVEVKGTIEGDDVYFSTDGEIFSMEEIKLTYPSDSKKVWVKVERAGYESFIGSVEAVIQKADLVENLDITITPYTGEYDGSAHKVATITKNPNKNIVIECSTDGGNTYYTVTDENPLPTITEPGTKEFLIRATAEHHNVYSAGYTAKIDNATIKSDDYTVEVYGGKDGAVYDTKTHDAVTVTADDFKVWYSTDGGNTYEEEVPTVCDVTELTVYIKLTRDHYNDLVLDPVVVKVLKADIDPESITIKGFNGTYKPEMAIPAVESISGVLPTDVLTYAKKGGSFSSTKPIIDEVADEGTYTVKIDRGSNYNTLDIDFEVKVSPAKLAIAFGEVNASYIYKEDNNFTNAVKDFLIFDEETQENVNITGKDTEELNDNLVYSLENIDGATAEIVEDSGCVTYETVGKIKVKATFKENSLKNYEFNLVDDAIYYETEVVYITTPEFTVTAPDYTDADKVEWYKGDVEIKAEGWEIIENSNALGQTAWAATVTKSEAGVYDAVKVAFRNSDGEISDVVAIDKFAIDLENPTVEGFEISLWDQAVDKVINFLSFGVFANDNVKVKVYVSDTEPASGIKEVALYIGTESTDEAYAVSTEIETDEKGKYAEFTLPESAIAEDSKYVAVISAKVTDNVGNVNENATVLNDANSNIGEGNSGLLMIENIKPVVSDVSYETRNNKTETTIKVEGPNGSENDKTVLVYDAHADVVFYAEDPDSGIADITVTINGAPVAFEKDYGEVEAPDNKTADTFKQKISFSTEGFEADDNGRYLIEYSVTDNAGNVSGDEYEIYQDLTAPVITDIRFTVDKEGNTDIKNEALTDESTEEDVNLHIDDFGYYFNKTVYAQITAEDIVSDKELIVGLKSITYVIVNLDTHEETEVTKDVSGEKATITVAIEPSRRFQIYAYATDLLENSLPGGDKGYAAGENAYNPADYNTAYAEAEELKGYVYPNATIVESEEKHLEEGKHITIALPKTSYKQNDGTPLYAKNVKIDVKVVDTYSGIRAIEWFVKAPYDTDNNYSGSVTVPNSVSGNSLDGWALTRGERNLISEMSRTFTVKNNSNDIELTVKMTDRAGNESIQTVKFGIDKTVPVIAITYGNDEIHDEEYVDYFRTNRTATVTITERNFRAENVSYAITNTDGVIPGINLRSAEAWKTKTDKSNPDNTTHTAVVKFTADGDYTFDISCVDNADHASNKVPQHKFTIDKTLPIITVVYDNNSARNGNYYKAKRTATITVKEHNFDPARVVISGTSTDAPFPTLSSWRNDGDIHVATLSYTQDSKYTFDIAMRDMAGNGSADFAQQEFYIDTTLPEVYLTGIVDESANADDGNIGFVLGATDKNFDIFTPSVSAIILKDGKVVVENVSVGRISNITNGKEFRVNNIEADGIYSVYCTVIDKAGNAYNQVLLENEAGDRVKEARSQSGDIVTFSVNRDGSVFALDGYTSNLTKDYYVSDVTEYVTIIEINADPIKEKSITVNGKKIKENTDYTVTSANNSSSWYKYTYKIDKSVFEKEGEYNVVVSTKDKADNSAFSDIKDAAVKFVVDRTAPVVTVAGLETDGKYQTSLQQVLLIPKDDGGMLKSVVVRTVDNEGNILKEIVNLAGEDLDKAIEEGQISFNLEEGVRQRVQIICEDFAGNISGSSDEECYSNVTVSSSAFTIFWVTDSLRWGVIGGATLLILAVVFIIIAKKRKNR